MHLQESGQVWIDQNFLSNADELYENLAGSIAWDQRMKARKVASFGVPYNYSGIVWPAVEFPPSLAMLAKRVSDRVGYEVNNCLAHYYPDGESNMGFHGDGTDDLFPQTGIAIVSLGATRKLTFRSATNKQDKEHYVLNSGSLFYMCPEMQTSWQHAILPETTTLDGRISLTFRSVKQI